MDQAQILELAMGHKLLASLDRSVLEKVIAGSKLIRYGKNRPVLKSGDPPSHVLFLLEGAMRVFYKSDPESDNEVLIKLFRGPALMCEMEVLANIPIMPNARTIKESEVLFMPGSIFLQLVDSYPQFARVLIDDFATRLCVASDRQRALAFADVERRFANLLLDYAQLSGAQTPEGMRIETSLTQDGMARDLAVSRKAVNNILQKLKQEGVLDKIDARYVILDMDALIRRSSRSLLLTHQFGADIRSMTLPDVAPDE